MRFPAKKRDKPCPTCGCGFETNWTSINAYLKNCKQRWFKGELKQRRSKVSHPLRKYYYGVVLPTFMEHLGYDKEEDELFHRQLKIVYFQIKPDKRGIHRGVPSVFSNKSELDVKKKQEYIAWVVRKAAENGAYVPDPGE